MKKALVLAFFLLGCEPGECMCPPGEPGPPGPRGVPGPPGPMLEVYYVQKTADAVPGEHSGVTAECPAGMDLLSGGCRLGKEATVPDENGWLCETIGDEPTEEITAYAICY